ncbi:class I SAM-dependent methyltransferase [Geomonas subterranea]|uniref:Class I SAM-dependent methyltransferase n=1 Tax=Geomonas subterranea TaxID=2847989 RepID=A0ABX8LBT0_9BACT|nr:MULTISPECIES: class I SAM-dependent methyltransferase [Geomonas]QXE89132.1 class I SAM-dependent methyltransferase [Geomonas subterranea]QXM08751.1 class I SAM-dependent methyltransferase [Geomonas subterranea]
MKPKELGEKYDKIAQWWHERHHDSQYGMKQLDVALKFASGRSALDVGCGTGGRIIRKLQDQGFVVTGIDVSEEMINLALQNHPNTSFFVQDICTWETDNKFDFIIAWDSIFHLPIQMHSPVIEKLCSLLEENGVLIYSFGNVTGEHTDRWHEDDFYYSSIGINGNLSALISNGLTIMHLELDQFPERHVYVVARKS